MIPHGGGFIKFAAIIWGLGALALAVYHRFQPRSSAGVPAAAPLPSAPIGMQPA